MTSQKSQAKYVGVPVGLRLPETPLPKPKDIEQCIWFATGECQKSGLRQHIKKLPYNGIGCKCFAYYSHALVNRDKGDYQI